MDWAAGHSLSNGLALVALPVAVAGLSPSGPFWFTHAVSPKAIKRTQSFAEFAQSPYLQSAAQGASVCTSRAHGSHADWTVFEDDIRLSSVKLRANSVKLRVRLIIFQVTAPKPAAVPGSPCHRLLQPPSDVCWASYALPAPLRSAFKRFRSTDNPIRANGLPERGRSAAKDRFRSKTA